MYPIAQRFFDGIYFKYDYSDFDLVVAIAGGDRAPIAKQKAEEIYPEHTPVVSSAGNSSDDAPAPVVDIEDDACP